MRMSKFPPALLLMALGLAACGGKEPAAQLAPDALPPSFVVGAAEGAGGVEWDGVVQAVEQAVLSAQTSGRVLALQADVDQRVANGAVLLRLTSDEQSAAVSAAEAQVRSTEAQQVDAASRLRRANELVGRQLLSKDEFDRIETASRAASAALDAARARLTEARQQLSYTTVKAPYAGVIASRSVELGETVSPGQPLFTVYAPGQLRLEVELPQAGAAAVRSEAAATVTLPDGRQVTASKFTVFPGADPLSHSTRVRVQLPSMEAPPRPGQTAKVRFAGGSGPAQIWIPVSAVVIRGELAAAYVVGDGAVVLRQLRLGSEREGRVQVIAGLAAGEQVAVDPVAALQWLRMHRGMMEAQRD